MKRSFTLLMLLCLLGPFAFGQADGIPPFGIADVHEVDTINLATLVPVLNIPVISKPGAIPFSYTMTSAQRCYIYGFGAGTATKRDSSPRFAGFVPSLLGSQLIPTSSSNTTCNGVQHQIYSGWNLVTSDGLNSHPVSGNPSLSVCGPTTFSQMTSDGSGYLVSVTAFSGDGNYPSPVFNIVAKNGHTCCSSGEADTSGNSLSISGTSNLTYTDTLGNATFIATPQSAGQNYPQYVQWTDPNGNTQQISLSFGPTLTLSLPRCTNVTESGTLYPINQLVFPDGVNMSFTMEQGINGAGTTTGRIASFTLRTGGTVSYSYPSVCTGLLQPVNGTLTRTTSDGTTTYTAATANGITTTTVLDPGKNKKVYYIAGQFLLGVDVYQNTGTVSSPVYALLSSDTICYNGNQTNCRSASPVYPISQRDSYHTPGGMSISSRVSETFDTTYGNRTSIARYDFGASSFDTKTTTTYGSWNGSSCVVVGNNIVDKPCRVTTTDSASHTIADATYSYLLTCSPLSEQVRV